ncbi:MAG: FUSC family protein [Bacteroidia bacterium]|nr:FUSC family protein [Bacteroidia bacterium]NNK59144.1 FUSC family protein [Flavobacteriaceae bacterium]NNL32205.1 FUSC family protein [Flavobacteriaceae bacterium]
MRLVLIILALLAALAGVALSILPFGSLALIPIILAFVLGLIAFQLSKKAEQPTGLIKLIFLVTIVALGLTIYRTIFDENEVAVDTEAIQKDEDRIEDAKKELEDINIDE